MSLSHTKEFTAPMPHEATRRGRQAFHSGVAAEDAVERHYQALGYTTAAKRWRRGGGELDLVMQHSDRLVFVEVKKARDFARAAERLTICQMQRITAGAGAFLATQPRGDLTECRFDVALVNGSGQVHILENAFGTV